MGIINMTEYGLLGKFEAYASEYSSQYKVARILSQERGIYRIISIDGERLGEISGKLRYNACCASDFPAVGDFVLIDSECELDNAVLLTAPIQANPDAP